MIRFNRIFMITLLLLIAVLIINSGCGSRQAADPVMAGEEIPSLTKAPGGCPEGTTQWGTWVIRFHSGDSENPASVEVIPIRAGMVHVDISEMLRPSHCSNCLEIDLIGVIDNEWTLNVTMTNPTVYTAYDVRGIFPGSDGPEVVLPDSYTDMFDLDGDSTTHHPFLAYDTDNPERQWGPGESYSRLVVFDKQPGEKYSDLIYVVTASWPDSQAEIVEISNVQVSGPLYTDTSNMITISMDVLDWQSDIEYVLMDMEPLNGSKFTHLLTFGGGEYELFNYTQYGLSPGSVELLIAAKSQGSDYITYNYVTVEVVNPPPEPTNFVVVSSAIPLIGDGAPTGEFDLAVAGNPDGTSKTFIYSDSTHLYSWNTDYTSSGLYLTLVDPSGVNPEFPVDPVLRIAVTDPVDPDLHDHFSFLSTNGDPGTWDNTTNPVIPFSNTLQIFDLETLQIVDFEHTSDSVTTPELDCILRPADVASGVSSDKAGYALWVKNLGAFPGYYPYVGLVRYESPYKSGPDDFDFLIGGTMEGSGPGKVDRNDVNGLAVWDGGGDGNIMVFVSEGGTQNEVEIFSADYLANPGGQFASITTLSGLAGAPVDIAVLPVLDAGFEEENWICILTDSNTIEAYTFSGVFVESVFDADAIPGSAAHIDSDIKNLRLHIISSNGPSASVIEYKGT